MNVLILTPNDATALEVLNAAGDPLHQLQPALLVDGRLALNADLLEDCGPGQTWERYGTLLRTLAFEANPEFPETNL